MDKLYVQQVIETDKVEITERMWAKANTIFNKSANLIRLQTKSRREEELQILLPLEATMDKQSD